MCGIIGFTLKKGNAVPMLLDGLTKLEYRGYDSAGIAVLSSDIKICKTQGRVAQLCKRVSEAGLSGATGIGHTRWATHGEPSDANAHPHLDSSGKIALIHNGIIENYMELRQALIEQGHVFASDTDTEVIVKLLGAHYYGNMLEALRDIIPLLKGSFALGVVCSDAPEAIYCARHDSPLVIGKLPDGGTFLSSDISTVLDWSRDICLLDDMDIAVLKPDGYTVYDAISSPNTPAHREIIHIDWDVPAAEKAGFPHFMLKEIHDEPRALTDTFRSYTHPSSPNPFTQPGALDGITRLRIVACGTAYHAGLAAAYAFEKLARIPVDVEIASEYRYRDALTEMRSGKVSEILIVISQSGETADTLAALRLAKSRGIKAYAVCNVLGSSIAREADGVIYTWAGPEIAVASTKAYTSQLMALYLLAIDFASILNPDFTAQRRDELYAELERLPGLIDAQLQKKEELQRMSHSHAHCKSVFYMGRGIDWALAQEGSLKLKEVSYVHSEAYAAGELKHGTIALIEPGSLVVGLITQHALAAKTMSNLQEVRVRGAHIMLIAPHDICEICAQPGDSVIELPDFDELLSPLPAIVPMQLFAYYMALERGCDIDKPRNLAKAVTVE